MYLWLLYNWSLHILFHSKEQWNVPDGFSDEKILWAKKYCTVSPNDTVLLDFIPNKYNKTSVERAPVIWLQNPRKIAVPSQKGCLFKRSFTAFYLVLIWTVTSKRHYGHQFWHSPNWHYVICVSTFSTKSNFISTM